MGKRKKNSSKRHDLLYQQSLQKGDMAWLADEYQKRSSSEPSLTLKGFADQYGVPADKLRAYLPELGEEFGHSVVVWHGTSRKRAESILKEGFIPKRNGKGRTFFTRDPAVARRYARSRANGDRESESGAIIMCIIDLNHYNDFEWRDHGIFVFRAECISSEVVRAVTGLRRQPRAKPQKRKDDNSELTDVALTFNSALPSIAYWLNSYLKLDSANRIQEDHEPVGKIKQWLDDQMDAGRFGEVPNEEMLAKVREYLPQYPQ